MLKNISLRMRLTLLSALVMASVAVILTAMFLFGADRIFVRDLGQQMTFQTQDIIVTSVKAETALDDDSKYTVNYHIFKKGWHPV